MQIRKLKHQREWRKLTNKANKKHEKKFASFVLKKYSREANTLRISRPDFHSAYQAQDFLKIMIKSQPCISSKTAHI